MTYELRYMTDKLERYCASIRNDKWRSYAFDYVNYRLTCDESKSAPDPNFHGVGPMDARSLRMNVEAIMHCVAWKD